MRIEPPERTGGYKRINLWNQHAFKRKKMVEMMPHAGSGSSMEAFKVLRIQLFSIERFLEEPD